MTSHTTMLLCKVRLVREWIKNREVVVGARRVRSEVKVVRGMGRDLSDHHIAV